jgi:chromosome segregation ATPase
MARPPSIDYDDFKAAADTLSAQGRELTFQALRELLGTISHAVLKRYLETYKAQSAAGMDSMPTGLFSGAQALYEQAKAEVRRELRVHLDEQLAIAQAQVHEATQALEIERAELLAKANSEQGKAGALQDQVNALKQELARFGEQHQVLQRQHELLRAGEEVARALLAQKQQQLEQQAQENQQTHQAFLAQQERLQERLQEFLATREQEHEQARQQATLVAEALRVQLQQASDQHASSLRDAQRHFLLELDKLRQHHAEQVATKAAQVVSTQELWAAARQDAAQWKNRVVELEQQIQMQLKSFGLIEMLVNAMSQVKDRLEDLQGQHGQHGQKGMPDVTDLADQTDVPHVKAVPDAPDVTEPTKAQGKPPKRAPTAASSKNTQPGPRGPR